MKMKNTISEMVNTQDGIFNGLDTVEKNDRTCGPNNRNYAKCTTQRTKTRKNVEDSSDI